MVLLARRGGQLDASSSKENFIKALIAVIALLGSLGVKLLLVLSNKLLPVVVRISVSRPVANGTGLRRITYCKCGGAAA